MAKKNYRPLPKDAQCSETDFLTHEFFFQFLLVFKIWLIQQWLTVIWGLIDFFQLDSETLISDTRQPVG